MTQSKSKTPITDSLTKPKIMTIGAYGFDEELFFHTLQEAGADVFCDIRQRRGVRGARYAFANSKRLQARLHELGISYFHATELAPTKAIRDRQNAADKVSGVAKRKRDRLDESFVAGYEAQILDKFDPQAFLQSLENQPQVITFFCVEMEPKACHRSLVASRFEKELGLEVEHKLPHT